MEIKYPEILDRQKASFLDGIILLLTLAIIGYYFQSNGLQDSSLKIIVILIIGLGYDPFLVSFAGGTIGHKIMNLKVKNSTDSTKKYIIAHGNYPFYLESVIRRNFIVYS